MRTEASVPRRLAQKLILSLTAIVIIIAALSGFINVNTEERQLVNSMILGVLARARNRDGVDREVADGKLRVYRVTAIEVVLISNFLVFFRGRFLGIPIRQLMEGTKAVSAMELDKPIDIIHASEELDHLARSFNVMRERLQAAMAEINQFTQQLESKVEQRTEQLKAAHQKLMQSDR